MEDITIKVYLYKRGNMVNYIVTTQGWSGHKVTECETEDEAWVALGDCSIGALTEVYSPTGMDVSQFIPF